LSYGEEEPYQEEGGDIEKDSPFELSRQDEEDEESF